MSDAWVRRVAPLLGLAVLLGLLVRQQRVPTVFSDTWLHLRIGQEFLDGWAVRQPGHLSAFDNADWIPTQWLGQELMAWMHAQVGIQGVTWLFEALALLLVGVLYATCRAGAAPLPSILGVAPAIAVCVPALTPRPQVLSYVLIVVVVGAWLRTGRDGHPRYWLIGLAWIWPMLHGMWIVGITISAAAVLGLALRRRTSMLQLARFAVIPVASAGVATLTPVGVDAYRVLVTVSSNAVFFAEWAPPDFTSPHIAVLAAMMALIVMMGLRSPTVDWLHVMLVLVALAWGLYSTRSTPVAALVLAPILAVMLQRLVPPAGRMTRLEAMVVASMVVVSTAMASVVLDSRPPQPQVPPWLDARLDDLAPGTRVLDDWDAGGYFLYQHPQLQLAMHGYLDVFTDDEVQRNVTISTVQPGWDVLVAEMDADVAVVQSGSTLAYALEEHDGWTLIEGDEQYVLLSPPAS